MAMANVSAYLPAQAQVAKISCVVERFHSNKYYRTEEIGVDWLKFQIDPRL